MKKPASLIVAMLLLPGASRPPSHPAPTEAAPVHANPIVTPQGGTAGTKPIGKANNGTNHPPTGNQCGANWQRCLSLCNRLYPPGTGVSSILSGAGIPVNVDARTRCRNRCDQKYVGHPC